MKPTIERRKRDRRKQLDGTVYWRSGFGCPITIPPNTKLRSGKDRRKAKIMLDK